MNYLAVPTDAPSSETLLTDRKMLYVVGAQRAGTTWIQSLFNRHAQLHTPLMKEVHYWDSVRPPYLPHFREKAKNDLDWYVRSGLTERYRRYGPRAILKASRIRNQLRARHDALQDRGSDHQKYASLMVLGSKKDQIIVDNTPAYSLLDHGAYAEMAGVCREAKFVLIMRDPVGRLWSGLAIHTRDSKPEDYQNVIDTYFRIALDKDEHFDRARSDYARTITELEQSIPPQRIMYIFFEDLFKKQTVDALFDFIGVARQEPALDAHPNANRLGWKLEPKDRAAAKERLAGVYEFVQTRFGDKVPEAWNS